MKNIVVFTYGDANNPSTWSNVPYLLTTTLEKKGYSIIKVDISTKQNILTYGYSLICKMIHPKTTYYFVRSNLNRKIVEKKIKNAVQKYDSNTELYISISFDYSPSKFTKKKVLLFSDWPMDYAIEKRFNRNQDFMERKYIAKNKEVIEQADYRISLMQDVANYMNKHYQSKTNYLGNVINSFYPIKGFEKIDNRNKITFIGKKSYYNAAKELINAFLMLDEKIINDKKLELHIIGMTKNDFKEIQNKNIFFHGYLDKGKEEEKEKYYQIIKTTLVIVNTSEKWAGISSLIECMYYYRPIITSRYDEFIKTFGKNINFGYYTNNKSKEIKKYLEKIISLPPSEYQTLANNAHENVTEFTYDAFIDKIINLVSK